MSKQMPFLLEACGDFNCVDSYFTERSKLKSFLLIYTIAGKGLLRYRNVEVELVANSCVFIDCMEYHYYKTVKDCNWEFYYFHLNGICAKNYFELINDKTLTVVSLQSSTGAKEMMREMFDLSLKNSELVDLKLSLRISELLTLMIEEKQSDRKTQRTLHKADIECARAFIDAQYNQAIDITTIAKSVSISKYYFIKLFKELLGQTPYDYLTEVRINTSKRLLLETERSISEVSKEVGYQDQNNFIKLFKKRTGLTPLKFRNKARAQL